jgi:hypothetical protein
VSTANLDQPLRTAIVGNAGITALLSTYGGAPAVFSRQPVPGDATYPLIVIGPNSAAENEDGLNDFRPINIKEILCYALNDTAAHSRVADDIAFRIRDLFHRQRNAITVVGWSVIDIRAQGPEMQFTDDQTTGRVVSLNIHLAKLRP